MAAPNFFYTDVAQNQRQRLNFPGQPGVGTLTTQPGSQNNPLFEGPPDVIATYTWAGTEAQYDIINIAIAPAGVVVSPNGRVSSGGTAPAGVLTMAIGDNDLGLVSTLPIPNSGAAASATGTQNTVQAPLWVAATAYVPGNVVVDAASTPTNMTYTCKAAVSGSTAPHSDSTNWVPNYQRYSTSINTAGAAGNVSFATGTQLFGGPASIVPASITPGTAPTGLTTAQAANQPYQIQNDCWLQALLLTCSTPVAGTVSVFRIGLNAAN